MFVLSQPTHSDAVSVWAYPADFRAGRAMLETPTGASDNWRRAHRHGKGLIMATPRLPITGRTPDAPSADSAALVWAFIAALLAIGAVMAIALWQAPIW
jgi:hypothetical protein